MGEQICWFYLSFALARGLVVTTCVDLNYEINKSPNYVITCGLAVMHWARCLPVQQSKGTEVLCGRAECQRNVIYTATVHTDT